MTLTCKLCPLSFLFPKENRKKTEFSTSSSESQVFPRLSWSFSLFLVRRRDPSVPSTTIVLHRVHPRFPEPHILFQFVFLEKHELGHEIVFLSRVCYWTPNLSFFMVSGTRQSQATVLTQGEHRRFARGWGECQLWTSSISPTLTE